MTDDVADDDAFPIPAPLPLAIRRLEPAGADGRSLAFSRDGTLLMSSTYVGHSVAWSLADGAILLQPAGGDVLGKLMGGGLPDVGDLGAMMADLGDLFGGEGAPAVRPKLTAAGQQALAGRTEPTGLHDVDRALGVIKDPADLSDAIYSPDGRLWALADEGELRLERADIGRPGKKLRGEIEFHSGINAAAFSADGEWLAAGVPAGCVSIWKTEWGDLVASGRAHRGEVLAVAFSPDRRYLASAAADRTVVLWSPPKAEPIARLVGWGGPGVTTLAFASVGDRLVLFCGDVDTFGAFDVPSLAPLARLAAPTADQPGLGLSALAVSPDGATLALSRGSGWVDLVPTAALLDARPTIAGDAVRAEPAPLVTEAEDEAAATAAEAEVRRLLDARLGGPLAQTFAALKQSTPLKAARVVFELDDDWTGDGLPFAWAAFDRRERDVAGLPELPEVGELLPESLASDPTFASATRPVEQVMFETFVAWLGEQWHAHGPANLPAFVHVHGDDDDEGTPL